MGWNVDLLSLGTEVDSSDQEQLFFLVGYLCEDLQLGLLLGNLVSQSLPNKGREHSGMSRN